MARKKNPGSKLSRREFLALVGTGTSVMAGAGFLTAKFSRRPVEQLIPYVVPPEDYIPGVAAYYNTVCNLCPAGCGITVRIREGRAKKIEGNPAHPVSQGGTCALGQSGLQVLYNPDRLQTPVTRRGERGTGDFHTVGWNSALTTVASHLDKLRLANRGAGVGLLTGDIRGHLDDLLIQFLGLMGSGRYLQYAFTNPTNLYSANAASFDTAQLPYYDIANSDFLLSFGADFLGMWVSPVSYSRAYGDFRQGRREGEDKGSRRQRGQLVQIEPRMSLTGANADIWVPAVPGTEGALALGIAHVIAGGAGRFAAALAEFDPPRVAEISGVEASTIERLARSFGDAKAPLAIGGGGAAAGTNGVPNLVAINLLNHLAGNIGREGGVVFNPKPAFGRTGMQRHGSYLDLLAFVEEIADVDDGVLIIAGTNPLYDFPGDERLVRALQRIPLVVGLSSFMDETMQYADIVLPVNSYLEGWGDDAPEPGVGMRVASISQPVVAPLYDTMDVGDVFIRLAQRMDRDMQRAMPWPDFHAYLRNAWRRMYDKRRDKLDYVDFDAFWTAVLEAGVWGETRRASQRNEFHAQVDYEPPVHAGNDVDYPWYFQPFVSQGFFDGRGANLPWQQELPDPMTSIVYGSWIELNPRTANELGVDEGDILEVSSPAGSLRAPVWITQGIRPDTVAMPIGQGHTSFGRYATGRGANPLSILSAQVDSRTGAFAWGATRVNLTPTGERIRFVKTGGWSRTLDRQILGPRSGETQEGGDHG